DRFVAERSEWRVVTRVEPTEGQWRDLQLAWRICAWGKSNAIVLVNGGQAVGIGAGQQNRVDSARIAAPQADGRAARGGGAIAAAVRAELAEEVASLGQVGIVPGLGTILVGDNPASASYVRLKHQDCEEIGIRSFGEHLAADVTHQELHEVIAAFNTNPEID